MLFDQFDKKLKEAADNHHPTYDEKAWLKMEKLLDKHMPVEKDRRRFLFLILFTLIGLGGAGVLIMKPWKEKQAVAIESKNPTLKSPIAQPVAKTEVEPNVDLIESSIPEKSIPSIAPVTGPINKTKAVSKDIVRRKEKRQIAETITPAQLAYTALENKTDPSREKAEIKNVFPGTKPKEDVFSLKQESTANKEDEPLTKAIAQEPASTKNKKKKQHALFLSVTAGPDWVFVENNGGSVKPFYGAGIGYAYNNRISLRTGFYAGRKVYSATPDYYNPPPNFYTYYPYLEKVDANCKVYEIPVSLSYHFGKRGKPSFFASAGLSSFIMKEEAYKYYYKTNPTGPTLNRSYTIKDVNKHKFAELTLSGGYTLGLTRHLSITAEPYLKLPLKGVGYGKVKLNSAGLAMSVSVNPFAKKQN